MKFKKVILFLTPGTDEVVMNEVIQWCKRFKSKLFVLFVVETNKISRLANLTHQKVETLSRKAEEGGWQLLYLLEDAAVEQGVRTSLHLEYGSVTHILKKYIDTYEIDIVFTKRTDETKKIFGASQVPVIGL
ncbi:hypothetical protein AMJ87_05870 [candidate division WOR_3 bacterium SM23_60]|uniref:UspA domain-containing protein n=1 Tax=candidate division WOR_3 bacterium SM23_60 TaxID=1703780 RepID=A0A0S8GG93_UNCW3|nr:MAG: hypothetical protein AMJ87_05870 [candidate division WOR_3 bacterium SM23_60]